VAAYWTFPPIEGGTCIDEGKTMLGAGVVNTVSDLWTTILPIPLIMQLKMPLKQRLGVCVLLCLGIVVTIAGALRTYFTWKGLMDSWDVTWHANALWIAAAVELDVGLVCLMEPPDGHPANTAIDLLLRTSMEVAASTSDTRDHLEAVVVAITDELGDRVFESTTPISVQSTAQYSLVSARSVGL